MSKYSHEDWHLITLSCYFSSFRWGRVELDTEGVLWSYPISAPHITLELGLRLRDGVEETGMVCGKCLRLGKLFCNLKGYLAVCSFWPGNRRECQNGHSIQMAMSRRA